MSTKVVEESHVYGDEYVWVADQEDIDELDKKISSLKSSIANKAAKVELKSKHDSLDRKINKIVEAQNRLKNNLVETLEDGAWKKTFQSDIEKALRQLERRFAELNKELDKKMIKLPQLATIQKELEAIFIKQEIKVRKTIISAGEEVQKQIKKNALKSDLVSVLCYEAKNITWKE